MAHKSGWGWVAVLVVLLAVGCAQKPPKGSPAKVDRGNNRNNANAQQNEDRERDQELLDILEAESLGFFANESGDSFLRPGEDIGPANGNQSFFDSGGNLSLPGQNGNFSNQSIAAGALPDGAEDLPNVPAARGLTSGSASTHNGGTGGNSPRRPVAQ